MCTYALRCRFIANTTIFIDPSTLDNGSSSNKVALGVGLGVGLGNNHSAFTISLAAAAEAIASFLTMHVLRNAVLL